MPKKIHVCATCGIEYITKHDKSPYCSGSCHSKSMISKKEIKCKECGETFEEHRKGKRIFCSDKCYRQHEHKGVIQDAVCTGCGKTFSGTANRRKKTENPYCSRKCYLENFPDKETKFFTFVCEYCGCSYERTRSGMDPKSKHRFCSKECNYQWAKSGNAPSGEDHYKYNSVDVPCYTCGKTLQRPKNRIRDYTKHFCDMTCMANGVRGKNHPLWKGGRPPYYGPNWKDQAAVARERDNYRCQHCGITQKKNGRKLDVHHLVPFRSFGYVAEQNDHYLQANELTNLISLCRNCHMRAEFGKIAIQPMLLWTDE